MRCQSVKREDITLNPNGMLTTPVTTNNLFSETLAVPDLEPGTKFCFAIGVFPSDSHNLPNDQVTTEPQNTAALNVAGTMWNYSAPTCVTITKKPTFQVWGGGLYAGGRNIYGALDSVNITTSQAAKAINFDLIHNGPTGGGINANANGMGPARRHFGSWSEYETIALGQVLRFGSGAGYGYGSNINGSYQAGRSPLGTNSLPGGHPSPGGSLNTCHYSKMTFANTNPTATESCSNSLGDAGIYQDPTIITRILDRYTDSRFRGSATQPANTTLELEGVCHPDIDGVYQPTNPNASYACLPNGTKYIYVDGDATIGNGPGHNFCMGKASLIDSRTNIVYNNRDFFFDASRNSYWTVVQSVIVEGRERWIRHSNQNLITNASQGIYRVYMDAVSREFYRLSNGNSGTRIALDPVPVPSLADTNRTSVVHVRGTLIVNSNFFYGDILGAGCSMDTYRSISELPQQMFIADEIVIADHVTNIDGWLIAGQEGTGNGRITTCLSSRFSRIPPDSTTCTRQLVVNGPVFAKELWLNRTAGAGHLSGNDRGFLPSAGTTPWNGNNSIIPAEVFNLRPDTYLWAFNQAERSMQAVVTHSRELAPRY
jgi:hypothetical protein